MLRPLAGVALTGALGLALVATAATAQPPKDPMGAPAGSYKLDTSHTSVVARVLHAGTSYSIFRFAAVNGTLTWDPAKVEGSKVDITLEPGSIQSPVPKFADELGGDKFLNAAKFPTAQFVSTSVKRTGPTTGMIMGNLTFMGVTKPMTINGELIGTGKNMRGAQTVGFTGMAKMKRSDWGYSSNLAFIGDVIDLMIDTEFDKVS